MANLTKIGKSWIDNNLLKKYSIQEIQQMQSSPVNVVTKGTTLQDSDNNDLNQFKSELSAINTLPITQRIEKYNQLLNKYKTLIESNEAAYNIYLSSNNSIISNKDKSDQIKADNTLIRIDTENGYILQSKPIKTIVSIDKIGKNDDIKYDDFIAKKYYFDNNNNLIKEQTYLNYKSNLLF